MKNSIIAGPFEIQIKGSKITSFEAFISGGTVTELDDKYRLITTTENGRLHSELKCTKLDNL
jgi:hypothetical protein